MNLNERDIWYQLLEASRKTHLEALQLFCTFPDDLTELPVNPHRIDAAALFENETLVASHPLSAAFQTASPYAQWRETYKNTGIDINFLRQFGCFALIGDGGAFSCSHMRSFVVYMPAGLYYPRHHHPAEEAYLVLAGSAEFHCDGEPAKRLQAGDISHHKPNQAHATTTTDEAMIAYVVWKGDLKTAPVWTDAELLNS